MKRLFPSLLPLCVLLAWSACSDEDDEQKTLDPPPHLTIGFEIAEEPPKPCVSKAVDPEKWIAFDYSHSGELSLGCKGACETNGDCMDGDGGVCIGYLDDFTDWEPDDSNRIPCECRYDGCRIAEDCRTAEQPFAQCNCHQYRPDGDPPCDSVGECASYCMDSNCDTGEDCPETGICLMSGAGPQRYCATDDDECRNHDYCEEQSNLEASWCASNGDGWRCLEEYLYDYSP